MSPKPNSHEVHPRDALFAGEKPFPVIPACEHFAGSEKLITKALELQAKMGRGFEITCDCGDGAEGGKGKQHPRMYPPRPPLDRHALAVARGGTHGSTHAHWKKAPDH